jgi:hypothetical protein
VATAQEKAIEMLETYDIVPNGSLINNKTSIGLSGAADLIEKYLVTIREKAEIQPEIIESYETNIETFDYAISKFSELRRLMKC